MTTNWLVAALVLMLLLYVGMGARTAVLLRRQGTPTATAWLAGLLAWPLVRRIVGQADEHPGPGHGASAGGGATTDEAAGDEVAGDERGADGGPSAP
ncbi:hypothetical protein [Egicoccus halophilus]|uniref:Uncharacterized protein n=1 Tax=Egicoccus halophilus TaxID=1670830 RepID=A0A8J3A6V4_9ACTN|nr:hypothetical protein [Egicoccus halophilus]GGI04765.1 hypothetical protein GCM10011354_10730 [Egicoccus halophilus]